MTRPTDEALEAMAVKLECDHWLDAADLLRACKGRGAEYLVEFDNGDSVSLSSMSGGASPEGVMGSISLMKETEAGETMFRRYKAVTDWTSGLWESPAPEPCPDHSEWNAAIEAAAKVAERRSTDGLSDDNPYNEGWRRCATITTAAIRNLKKGSGHD